MTATVSRRIPPQRLVNLMNPLVRALLTSPLHAALDGALLVLHIRGRKTGRGYDIPVGYTALDQNLVVVTQHTWRVNLRGGADIDVTHRGRRQKMHTHLDEDPVAVAAILHTIIDRIGPNAAQRQLGLKFHGQTPSLSDLETAVRAFHLSTLTLGPITDARTSPSTPMPAQHP